MGIRWNSEENRRREKGEVKEEEKREGKWEARRTLMGKPPQATFDTEPSGKTKSAKRKKETEVGGVFVSTQSTLGRCEESERDQKTD